MNLQISPILKNPVFGNQLLVINFCCLFLTIAGEKTPITIEAIYRLAREGEEDALNKLKVGNHQLLWHGTKSSNLISILKRGLLTQPIESAGFTGNLFGQVKK